MRILRLLVPNIPLSAFLRDALYVPRGGIMGADAASLTAERLTGPSPGSGMDGGVLLCQLVEGVSTVSRRGQSPMFCVCAPHGAAWYPRGAVVATAENLRDIRGGRVLSTMQAGQRIGCQKVKILTFLERRGMLSHSTAHFVYFRCRPASFWYQAP